MAINQQHKIAVVHYHDFIKNRVFRRILVALPQRIRAIDCFIMEEENNF